MTGLGRVPADQYARRVNAAAGFLARGLDLMEAARRLARRYEVSERQARRYVDKAHKGGAVQVPSAKLVLTVKVPVDLVRQMRSRAERSGQTLSALVAQALGEFLGRRGGGLRGGGSAG